MEVGDTVRAHYSGPALVDAVLAELRTRGVDTDHLQVDQLAEIDQLHAGFLPATRQLLGAVGLDARDHLLDVGCGVGGAARVAAADTGCRAVGVDLSPDFVAAARTFTDLVGLSERVTFALTDGARLPFEDESFDVATLIHVGMNVPDKAALFTEVHRVLRPGARFGLFEQMRTGPGPLTYPLPWAVDASTSFVESVDAYEQALLAAGFTVVSTRDRTAEVAGPAPGSPAGHRPLPIAVFGPEFLLRIQNNIAATRAGSLGAVQVIAARG